MPFSLTARLHAKLALLGACMAGLGACLGYSLWGWWGAAAGASLTSVYAVGVTFFYRRRVKASLPAAGSRGKEEGLADAVVAGISVYEAAVFPLTPGGVSKAEQKARRTVAYWFAAYEALPSAVRVSAAVTLEAIEEGLDPKRAQAVGRELALTAYDCRAAR